MGNLDALAAASEDDGMVVHDIAAAAQGGEADSAVFAFAGVPFLAYTARSATAAYPAPSAITSPSLRAVPRRCIDLHAVMHLEDFDVVAGCPATLPASSSSLNTVLTPSE